MNDNTKRDSRPPQKPEPTAVDDELQKLRDELRAERDLLARERKEIAGRLAALESKSESEHVLQSRLGDLEKAVRLGNTLPAYGGSGVTIEVKRGDFIAYDTTLMHNNVIGGWVKANKDDPVNRRIPMIAVANKGFVYDKEYGAPYHSVNFKMYKRFFQDSDRNQVVGDGLPVPIIETSGVPRLTMV